MRLSIYVVVVHERRYRRPDVFELVPRACNSQIDTNVEFSPSDFFHKIFLFTFFCVCVLLHLCDAMACIGLFCFISLAANVPFGIWNVVRHAFVKLYGR